LSSRQARDPQEMEFRPIDESGHAHPVTAALPLDLRFVRAGVLSFQHRWASRCASGNTDPCSLDNMSISYRDTADPTQATRLVTADQLRSPEAYEGRAAPGSGQVVSVPLPDAILGTTGDLLFEYDPGSDTTARDPVVWAVANVQVLATPLPEEVVVRHYDSADPPSGYADATLVVDLGFDVVYPIVDRSAHSRARLVAAHETESIRGVVGKAIGFASDSAGLEMDFGGTQVRGLTVQIWVRWDNPGSPPSRRALVGLDGVANLSLSDVGKLECTIFTRTGERATVTAPSIPASTWVHVALTYEPTAGFLKCFVNGALGGSTPAIGSLGALGRLALGHQSHGDVTGTAVDELQVYASSRSEAQVLGDALRPISVGPPRGNVLYFLFGQP
jgi:hypothetical protein